MPRRHHVRVRKPEGASRAEAKRAELEHIKREKVFVAVRVTPEQYAELKKPEVSKKYIQKAIELSVRHKNRDVLMAALSNVASATDNKNALRYIAISDGDFLSINDILLELGFCLQFKT